MPRYPSSEAISALSSPQTKAPAPMRNSMSKLKPLPRMFSAQEAALAGLRQGDRHVLDGDRILGADIHESVRRADGVGGDHHPFDHLVRDAFQQGCDP